MTDFEPPEVIYGVDFSADKTDAGRNTWIAKAVPDEDQLVLEQLTDAAETLECAPRRETILHHLVENVLHESGRTRAYGLDFPFGLPAGLLTEDGEWHDFIEELPGRWGDLGSVKDPDSLYSEAQARAERDGVRLDRCTDAKHGGQDPTGYRIKTQTFYGISELLAEIADDVSILPMNTPDSETYVLETYPRAVFNSLDAAEGGYKHNTRQSIEKRQENIDALREHGVEFNGHCPYALASDDALDAVAAGYATWRATRSETAFRDRTKDLHGATKREGYIFA